MYDLRLFGGASIEDLDGDAVVPPRARQRHRLGLLALLAVKSRGLSRDKLIGYLWPENDAKRARNLLSVSLYVLRGSFGEESLLSPGDDVRLNRECIRADVAEFEQAMERGDHEAAVKLYGGPFLDGFFLPDSREFELWADRQRERLARMYAGALEALANEAEVSGDARGAVKWWKRRVAHDRFDSRVTVRLMRALEAGGNRAAALELADVHAALLREEFGTEPPPEVSELAERLREVPATASPSLAADPEPTEPAAHPTAERAPREPRPVDRHRSVSRQAPAVRVAAAGLLVLIALAGVLWAAWPEATAPDRSIAVLPFASLGPEEEGEFFGDGVTEEIILHLSAVPELKVISRTSAMRYRESDRPLGEIADELDVAHILEGTVRQVDESVRISVQLIDAASGYHTWSSVYDGELVDIFDLQERIAQEVVDALAPRLGARGTVSGARRGTRDPEALDLFLRGRHHWKGRTAEGHRLAQVYFERAIEQDSSYADAYAGLAFTYLTNYQLGFSTASETEIQSRLKRAAERALALDESSAEAHVALAMSHWWQRNWPGAEREFLRALELNPGHATARTWYTLLLMGWGRLEEALDEIRRANDVDPFAVVTGENYAEALYLLGRYDLAVEKGRRTMELDPRWGTSQTAMAHAGAGDFGSAVRVLRPAIATLPDSGDLLADLAYVTAAAGDRDEAADLLRRAKRREAAPFHVGRAHVALGEPDSAFAWLRRSPWEWPHRANRFDPALDPVRDDPRFAEMSAAVDRELGVR